MRCNKIVLHIAGCLIADMMNSLITASLSFSFKWNKVLVNSNSNQFLYEFQDSLAECNNAAYGIFF